MISLSKKKCKIKNVVRACQFEIFGKAMKRGVDMDRHTH
jgi:hypothetical protein